MKIFLVWGETERHTTTLHTHFQRDERACFERCCEYYESPFLCMYCTHSFMETLNTKASMTIVPCGGKNTTTIHMKPVCIYIYILHKHVLEKCIVQVHQQCPENY